VLHWNLPSNPVDLEQREGRVNRRDCLAVRESIARDWPLSNAAIWDGAAPARNPWPVVFDTALAHDSEQRYKHGLFPHWIYECRHPADTVHIQRHVPVFSTSRDAAKYARLKTGLALYRLVFGQANQEDLLEGLQRQMSVLSPEEHRRAFKRIASYMLNLSPIGHEQALQHAREEASALLAGTSSGLLTLLQDVERLRVARAEEMEDIDTALTDLTTYIRRWLGTSTKPSRTVHTAVAALAYLRNPYDRIFDLHVEGGFADDMVVVSDAWHQLQRHRSRETASDRSGVSSSE
jgi:uncharacterized membrane protein YkvA (DUF1232 family)